MPRCKKNGSLIFLSISLHVFIHFLRSDLSSRHTSPPFFVPASYHLLPPLNSTFTLLFLSSFSPLDSTSSVSIIYFFFLFSFFSDFLPSSVPFMFLVHSFISFHSAFLRSPLYGRPFTCIPLHSHSLPPSLSSPLLPVLLHPSLPLPVTAHPL